MATTSIVLDAFWRLVIHPAFGVLIALLLAAAVTDWRARRIPNWLTGAGVAYALVANAWLAPSALDGLLASVFGFGIGLLLPMPLYLLRATGAGDVKLFAMIGAFVGPAVAWQAVLASFIVGGIAAVVMALSQRALGRLMANTSELVYVSLLPGAGPWLPTESSPSVGSLPYAVSIGTGTTALLLLRQILAS